jgi:hypothetical protein
MGMLDYWNYFLDRRIDENIRVSSWDSFDKVWHSGCLAGFALAIIRSQCLVSFDSFLQMEILCWKSLFDSAPSASI